MPRFKNAFVRVRQYATSRHLAERTVWHWVANHTIPSRKIGSSRLIDPAEADHALIEAGKIFGLPEVRLAKKRPPATSTGGPMLATL